MDKLNLNDVGTVRSVDIQNRGGMQPVQVRIIMGIKAPRGQCFLFQSLGWPSNYRGQAKAIKAFMEEHTYG